MILRDNGHKQSGVSLCKYSKSIFPVFLVDFVSVDPYEADVLLMALYHLLILLNDSQHMEPGISATSIKKSFITLTPDL